MTDALYPVPREWAEKALIDAESYARMYRESVEDPWADVEIEKALMGFFMVSDNTMQPGKVVAEVDPEPYIPHYYKMTDFYYG